MSNIMLDQPRVKAPFVVGRSSLVMIGTRASKLALVQTHMIRDQLLAAHTDLALLADADSGRLAVHAPDLTTWQRPSVRVSPVRLSRRCQA